MTDTLFLIVILLLLGFACGAAFNASVAKIKIQNPGVWIWGSLLGLVAAVVVISLPTVLIYCGTGEDATKALTMTCSESRYAAKLYVILRDWGTGIGALGAGAGLAWASFYKKDQDRAASNEVAASLDALKDDLARIQTSIDTRLPE